jgi:hypothetical protein
VRLSNRRAIRLDRPVNGEFRLQMRGFSAATATPRCMNARKRFILVPRLG